MTLQRLRARMQRVEQATTPGSGAETLHVWRVLEESAAAALTRCAVDSTDWPPVRIRVWGGGRVQHWVATGWRPRLRQWRGKSPQR